MSTTSEVSTVGDALSIEFWVQHCLLHMEDAHERARLGMHATDAAADIMGAIKAAKKTNKAQRLSRRLLREVMKLDKGADERDRRVVDEQVKYATRLHREVGEFYRDTRAEITLRYAELANLRK